MFVNLIDKIKIYKLNTIFASFLFSYPSTYLLKNKSIKKDIQKISNKRGTMLYIHIPFCFNICTFCNVHKVKLESKEILKEYLNILFEEIKNKSKLVSGEINTIYIGGGTPTLLDLNSLNKLFILINKYFNIKKDAYIEIDAYPSTINKDKLKLLKEYNVNQISIGIQSMENTVLKSINRIGQTKQILEDLSKLLKDFDFKLHFDFIIGLPNENINNILKTVKFIANLFNPYSISINGYDNTIDTILYSKNKNRYRNKQYKKDLKNNITFITNILYKKFKIKRRRTVYFNNFYKKHYNVIGIGAGSYSFIGGQGFFKNPDYKDYILKNKESFIKGELYEEKRMFIIHNYNSTEINEDYYQLFGTKIINDFKNKLDYFIKKGYLKINNKGNIKFYFKNNHIARFELINVYSDNILRLYEL